METKNKYYTPSIEEFHVGFEHEQKDDFGDGKVKTQQDFDESKWIKCITRIYEFPYIERMLTGKNAANGLCGVRVKFLDREDIESFGFKCYKEHAGTSTIELEYNNYNITFDFNWSDKWNITISEEEIDNTLFHGYIKNKSELKKVLTQLGILNEHRED